MIKTRFAPSPTGWLHIGGVRTALYSWLFAKNNEGEFYLRIDDTDKSRSDQKYLDSILSSLDELDLKSDKDVIYQSQRLDIYIDNVEILLNNDHAYYDKIEINEKTKDTDLSLEFDNRLNKEGYVIRFRNPKQEVVIEDLIHGPVKFSNKAIHDIVILRSNGMPTYNITSVIDDNFMGITHIIRGDDHLNNTPVQQNIFHALGFDIPKFAHLPMIHGTDGKRLSKRHGAVNINKFLEDGYLKESVINYLAKTGWSHGDQEFFSISELKKLFSLNKVTKSSAIFDYDKLNWLNQQYIKKMDLNDVAKLILPYLQTHNLFDIDMTYLKNILSLGIEREYTLKEIAKSLVYYFIEEIPYDTDDFKKFNPSKDNLILDKVIKKLSDNNFEDEDKLGLCFQEFCQENGLKFKDFGPVVRFGLTGRLKAPAINEICFLLGKTRTIDRLNNFQIFMSNNAVASNE